MAQRTEIPMLKESSSRHFTLILTGEETMPQFECHGCAPDEVLKLRMTESFRRVFELAPSQSTLRVRVDLMTSGFKFHVLLGYGSASLYAMAKAPTPRKALQLALDQIYLKIRNWRLERYAEEFPQSGLKHIAHDIGAIDLRKHGMSSQRPSVLIVDDNLISIKLMETCLHQLGCETISVIDGNEAVKLITSYDFDLLVLDWQMPTLSGEETLICAQDRISYDSTFRLPWVTNQLPVLTYSGEIVSEKKFPKCENFEFVGHLSKETQFPDLMIRTSEVLMNLHAA